MSLSIDQTKRFTFKEFALFASVLFIIGQQIVAGTDFWCPEETLTWGPDDKPITWPETIASDKKIASDCIASSKLLLARNCDSGLRDWNPNLDDTKTQCVYYRESYDDYVSCPPGYIESKIGDWCYQKINSQSWTDLCLKTGASSLSFLDLSFDEQFNILQELQSHASKGNVGLPAKNTIPNVEIDNTTEKVELRWLLPAKYGSILRLSNNSFKVTCGGYQNLCFDTCLSINPSQSTADMPFQLTLETCDNINSVLCVSRRNSFVRDMGCSTKDYYRVGYSTSNTFSYSIKIFDTPLTIDGYSPGSITEFHCEGNKLFRMDTVEYFTIYRQLASIVNLTMKERCLFGASPFSDVVTYNYWGHADPYEIKFTNWDKSVDLSTVQSRSDSFLTVNSQGEWSWEESATCIVCAMDDTPTLSQLILEFSTLDSKLTLRVVGRENLWREDNTQLGFLCFALIGNNYAEVHVEATSQGSFSLANVGAGSYWCSGHLIQTIDLIQSNSVAAFGMVFAFDIQYHCEAECVQPFDVMGKFDKFLSSFLSEAPIKIDDSRYIDSADNIPPNVRLMFHVMMSTEEEISHDSEFNEISLPDDELYTYYILKVLQGLPSDLDGFPFDDLLIASREFCLPDTLATPNLNWKAAKVGETIELSKMDFTFTRTCSRNGTKGAVWDDYQIKPNKHTAISRSLTELHNNFRSTQQIPEVLSNLSTTLQNVTLDVADVFIVSEIIEKVSEFLTADQVGLLGCELQNVFDIFNDLMLISEDVAATTSSQLNSTNSLLASLDEILINQAQNMPDRDPSSIGILSIKNSFIANYIIDPSVNGYSGIALFDADQTTDDEDFLSYAVQYLKPNRSLETILLDKEVILASFVPQELIETWKNPKIIFTLFFNDILFQKDEKQFNPDGSIISLSILNSNPKLSSSIPFFYKANTTLYRRASYASEQFCGHWSLSDSEWDGSGCLFNNLSLQRTDTILCECSHLTHFGNLVNTDNRHSENDEKALNLITLIGCSLSLAGIIGIFLTAIIFRSWRSKSSSKFLLQLSAAIAVQMILLIFINSNDDVLTIISKNLYGCIAIGALVHYSILVMFFWMLIVAYLQFIRYVIVFNQIATANFLLKSSIFGWGMPMLPVFIVVAVDPTSYIPSSNIRFCYPSGLGLWFGLLVPIILIVIANMVVFIAVIVSLVKGSSKSAACKVSDKNEAIWSQLRLSVFLFFVLGLSWIFAFLSSYSVLFSYLFCLTATFQGLVLFFYFVILDPVARNLWHRLLRRFCCYRKSK
ncbi:uncharacterized protein LOC119073203 [Bradysia coprophila]|uniref:uncharacterized protein LOC119073203 n=1 Tax=Bradysia coprophila TaxID=38358 RepID=UPI00187D7D12|nr:uncharacterized protein LOC119073203 [Bradysia coprophila]